MSTLLEPPSVQRLRPGRVLSLDDLDALRPAGSADEAFNETYVPLPDAPEAAGTIDEYNVKGDAPDPAQLLHVIKPTDMHALNHIAAHIAQHGFWTDDMLANALPTFMHIFANPANFVVGVGDYPGDGVLAYVRDAKPWRASLFGCAWNPTASAKPYRYALGRAATQAAFLALGITALDGVTAWDNAKARRGMEELGLTYRGRLPGALLYAGETVDAAWYEILRADALGKAYRA